MIIRLNKAIIALCTVTLAIAAVSCDNTNSATTTSSADEATSDQQTGVVVDKSNMKIAYVNTDSLFENYALRNELEEEFIEEKLVMENRFKAEVDAFEKDYRDAEAGASQLSQEALQILSMKLQQREQELMVKKQEMEGQLMQSEQAKNDKLFEGLRSFLDEYASNNGYHTIYGYNGFGDILYMDPSYDITNEVVNAINEEYENQQTADSATE